MRQLRHFTSDVVFDARVRDFKVVNGLAYLTYGQVYNPESATLLGAFAVPMGGYLLAFVQMR